MRVNTQHDMFLRPKEKQTTHGARLGKPRAGYNKSPTKEDEYEWMRAKQAAKRKGKKGKA